MKIAIVCDSGSGLDYKTATEQGIYFLPLQIIDEDKTYLDGYDSTVEDIYTLLVQGKMLKTSLPPLGLIQETFHKIKEDGYDHVIAVMLTEGLSSTMHSIRLSGDQTGITVTCVDSFTTAHIQKYIAQSAKRLVDEGFTLEEIIDKINDAIEHSNTLIIPNDLDHLKRGGRLTPLAAALGGMLKIKPILQLNKASEGKIDTHAKVRTMSKAMQIAVSTFEDAGIDESYELVVLHTNAPDTAKQLEALYFNKYPITTHVTGLIGPILAVHTGLGCVGLQYIKKI